jgi:hypothetical protein
MGKSVLHSLIASRRCASQSLLLVGRSSERKRLLKMCVRKLQSIEDPETFLCRSVLINNTLKTLQTVQREARAKKEAREEQLQRIKAREAVTRQMDSEQEKGQQEEGASAEDSELLGGGDSSAASGGGLNLMSCDDESYDLGGGYNAEDILSDIVMPPPLSPQLEDMTHMEAAVAASGSSPVGTVVVPASSSPSMSEGSTAGLSPLLSGHSPLSSGKVPLSHFRHCSSHTLMYSMIYCTIHCAVPYLNGPVTVRTEPVWYLYYTIICQLPYLYKEGNLYSTY